LILFLTSFTKTDSSPTIKNMEGGRRHIVESKWGKIGSIRLENGLLIQDKIIKKHVSQKIVLGRDNKFFKK
jgi:hypothetical protein